MKMNHHYGELKASYLFVDIAHKVAAYQEAHPEKEIIRLGIGDVTQPLENALSVLNGVKNVTSQSNENYSLIFLEYQDDTDMDSAMVKASTAVNQLGDALPDMASTPTLMEISPDMMATQYVAADYDGMDIYELSDYVSENVLPQLERVDGVASVSTTGLVEKSVQITRDQDKIDAVNDKLLVKVSDRLAEAKKQLDENEAKIKDGLAELDSAQSQLDSGKAQLNTQKQSLTQQLRAAIDQLNEDIRKLADTYNAFADGTLKDVKGFCAVATTEEIAKQDYILTPGRYVGIEEQQDDGEPFEEKMTRLTKELSEMFRQSHELEAQIRERLRGIGYEV